MVFIRPFLYSSGLFVQPVVLSVAWKGGDTMTTLENLYYGNIAPHEYEVERGSEYDGATKHYTRKNQRQSHRIDEPRRTRRVLPRFLFGCQTSDRSHELQNLTHENSPCVARIKRSQSYPTSPEKAHTTDLSRSVGAKNCCGSIRSTAVSF